MDDIQKIIEQSKFVVHEGRFLYLKVKNAPDIDQHFLITKDADEITVITKEENLTNLEVIEKNKDIYGLVELKVSLPFYSVGFLASVSSALAKEEMNILIVSTYSKDYILVKQDRLNDAVKTLITLGFKE